MVSKLENRLARLEAQFKPRSLRAVIQIFFAKSRDGDDMYRVPGALPADDPRLQHGVNADGEAFVSRWWAVTFFEGSEEQQNKRLNELRLDARYQKPCTADEFPARFEGGATYEDAIGKADEQCTGLSES